MNILHLCNAFSSNELYNNLFNSISYNNKKLKQYVFITTRNSNKKIISKTLTNSITIIKPFKYKFTYKLFFTCKIKNSYNHILNNINITNINVIHAHTLFSDGAIAYKLNKKYKINYIVAIRNVDINFYFKYLFIYKKLGLNILLNASKIIIITPSYKNILLEKYIPTSIKESISSKIIIIPNGIDNFWFQNINYISNRTFNFSNINLLYVGDFKYNKNVHSILSAFIMLQKSNYNLNLFLVGSGSLYELFLKIYSFLFLIPKIHFIKRLTNKLDLLNVYQNSDIFIMPSHNETFGLVYIESLTQNIPIIYSRNQGVDGFFNDSRVGISVNSKNVTELYLAVKNIINNYSYFQNNCIKESLRFNWDDISKEYLILYRNIY